MAILTREQFMEKLNTVTDGKTDDDTLAMIQDFSETFKSLEDKEDVEAVRGEYEEKLKTLDDTWRNKYRETFFNGVDKKDEVIEEKEEEETEEPRTYEDLFKEEED
nr:MAG TPA: hypothetical protein [Caudoviricetes sp.]